MDKNPWISMLLILLQLTLYISVEGNVTVTWNPPQTNPLGWLYQVQWSEYTIHPAQWIIVPQCSLLQTTTCNIGMITNNAQLQVRVGILMPEKNFSWSTKKLINIKRSQLLAPSFTLSSTSHSVQVKVHKKQWLYEIFPYGLQYTAYLWPDGQENQTLIRTDDSDDGEMKFNYLQTWHVYCVRVKVESASTDASNISSESCIQLPLDTTLIIYFAFLGALGSAGFLMIFVCFIRRPGKMPASLKPVVHSWSPMIVGLDKVETVTDKGWLLIANKTEIKRQMSEEKHAVTEEEKERRESLDSGVSMELSHPSALNASTGGQMGDTQVDSGCGSLKGPEGSGNVGAATAELLSLDERSRQDRTERKEDSGLGLAPHEASGCLDREDIELLSGVGVRGGYRSQSPASVDILNERTDPCEMDTNMAAPSGGYRSGQGTCTCSDYEHCVWCKFRKSIGCQSGTQTKTYFSQLDSDNGEGASGISTYLRNSIIQTVNVLGIEEDPQSVFPQSDMSTVDCSELLLSCPLLLHCEENQLFTMDALSFTLDDVEFASPEAACV
ncbi:interleukin-10 receptor subunit alpha isoform X2 [Electrophorus electricus]|uniref:interleukin-10 receptor subunit alpha isoform X2 n=1 Tax=Electrophorus electricus TaxID=8005 RepID=UPI0015CFE83D|nr:interleukin-10 receptor subunit alpha isoform X2 [Electrophorus electricus]